MVKLTCKFPTIQNVSLIVLIWHGERCPPPCQISPHRCNDMGIGPPKLKFLLRFDQNVKYKRPVGGIPSAIFTKFAEFVPRFRMRQLLKLRWICSRGYGVIGVFNFSVDGVWLSPNFQRPLAAKLCVRPQSFGGTTTCMLEVLYHHAMFGVARISPAAGRPKTLSFLFVCLSVCPSRF